MAETTYYCATSLDGYIADSDHGLGWLLEAAGEPTAERDVGNYDRFYAGVEALCMGSATYDFILDHGGWPYAGKPTWVFTRRELPVPDGADVRFARDSPADLREEMEAAAGDGTLWLVGGGDLASQFVDHGMLDKLIATQVPVALGTGIPVFARPVPGMLDLLSSEVLPGGLAQATYALPRAL